ncbi:hypothetical protein Mapa_015240 [Marchantia paleacea]|nr:hypothetical protein Mapa_015240 [Marchantia paleacea]
MAFVQIGMQSDRFVQVDVLGHAFLYIHTQAKIINKPKVWKAFRYIQSSFGFTEASIEIINIYSELLKSYLVELLWKYLTQNLQS